LFWALPAFYGNPDARLEVASPLPQNKIYSYGDSLPHK
jgi:hypothetical protein